MLSLPSDGRHPKLELVAQQRRQKTLEALTTQLELLARSNPVLMVFEDVHWVDPTTLEVLGRTVDRLKTLRVLLVITYRPEFEPPWLGRPYVTALNLNGLGDRDIAPLIDQIAGNKSLPERVRQDIVERADGVPLFVEELAKTVVEDRNAECVALSFGRSTDTSRLSDGSSRPVRADCQGHRAKRRCHRPRARLRTVSADWRAP